MVSRKRRIDIQSNVDRYYVKPDVRIGIDDNKYLESLTKDPFLNDKNDIDKDNDNDSDSDGAKVRRFHDDDDDDIDIDLIQYNDPKPRLSPQTNFDNKSFSVPYELIPQIFSYIPSIVLYDKLIKPYSSRCYNLVQRLAMDKICQPIIIRNCRPKSNLEPISFFYKQDVIDNALVINSFKEGYGIIRTILKYSLENNWHTRTLISFYFHFYRDGDHEEQLDYYLKILELLAFDSYYRDMAIVDILIKFDMDPPKHLHDKIQTIRKRTLALESKVSRLYIGSRSPSYNYVTPFFLLLPYLNNLQDIRLYNGTINDGLLRSPSFLKNKTKLHTIYLTGNNIGNIDYFPLPISVQKLFILANSLVSLEGFNIENHLNLTILDLSVNMIDSLESIKFPPNLKIFRAAYNRIKLLNNVCFPSGLEILLLSNNEISNLDSFTLPKSLTKLFLTSNKLESLPPDFFTPCSQLKTLHFDNNLLNDVDDLGDLPNSLQNLILDNNIIDNPVLNNILKPNLKHLSMYETALITLNGIQFPDSLEHLELSSNEISEIHNVKFGGENLKYLNLSSNCIKSFDLIKQNISILGKLTTFDINNNPFSTDNTEALNDILHQLSNKIII